MKKIFIMLGMIFLISCNQPEVKLSGEYKKLLSKEYEDIYKRLSKKERIKIRLAAYFPLLVKWKRRLTKSK